jgi:hypothetical protein
MPARHARARRKMRLCAPYAPSARRREILDDRGLAGWKPKAPLRVVSSQENKVECVMKEELTTILDAMRAAQAELADYLVSADRNAELTIAKLVGILERREVVRAMRALHAPGRAPQRTFAEAS